AHRRAGLQPGAAGEHAPWRDGGGRRPARAAEVRRAGAGRPPHQGAAGADEAAVLPAAGLDARRRADACPAAPAQDPAGGGRMVTVRLFGTLRLDAGRRQVEVDAATVAEALEKTAAALGLPGAGPLLQAAVFVNGERAG